MGYKSRDFKPKGTIKYSINRYKDRLPTGSDLPPDTTKTKQDLFEDLNSKKDIDNLDKTLDDSQGE